MTSNTLPGRQRVLFDRPAVDTDSPSFLEALVVNAAVPRRDYWQVPSAYHLCLKRAASACPQVSAYVTVASTIPAVAAGLSLLPYGGRLCETRQ